MFQRSFIPELILIEPRRFEDSRGVFCETYHAPRYAEAGIPGPFPQDNQSRSRRPGVVRGLHFQIPPHAQGKLVRCTRGAIFDVAVDIRRGSPTFAQHESAVLSADNGRQFWIPAGFAHGFCALEADTEVQYKTTSVYAPDAERGLAWDDPALAIAWPVTPGEALLSDKDKANPPLSELDDWFQYDGAGA